MLNSGILVSLFYIGGVSLNDFFDVITLNDIVFAFAAAVFLTYLINRLRGGYRFIGVYGAVKINYSGKNLKTVVKSCCELFPKDNITFQGSTFKRGSRVQILTNCNQTIIGELIGANNDNMICLITAKHIIAQELSQILSITPLPAEGEIEAGNTNGNTDSED